MREFPIEPRARRPADNAWPDELVKRLVDLKVNKGLSAGAIGVELRRSRNAVIGKLTRMGIRQGEASVTLRSSQAEPRPPRRKPEASKVSRTMPTIKRPPKSLPAPVRELESLKPFCELRAGECRYPYGDDPATMRACGRPVLRGKSYCPHHFRVTHRTS